ncbi:hypothetical protein TWF481_010227 [Arthrobotrys musiformis]|uniref:Uncharacterized protein n=1 Tax=Arthrobotrys musiformis TaxID=47236 RepID=A0AAV9W0C7_9PEZI
MSSDPNNQTQKYQKTYDLVSSASFRIEKVLEQARLEAWKIVNRVSCKTADKTKAYILGSIALGKVSYLEADIESEYVASEIHGAEDVRESHQSILDEAAGFHFRRLIGLEIIYQRTEHSKKNLSQITLADIAYFYKTLVSVARICDEGFEYHPQFGWDKSTYEKLHSGGYIFQRLSPLSFTALLLNKESVEGSDITDWPGIISKASPKNRYLDAYGVQATAHVAATAYFLEKSLFIQVVGYINSHHLDYLVDIESHMLNDAPMRLSILLRHLETFEHLFNLYHEYRTNANHTPQGPSQAVYPRTLPGLQDTDKRMPNRLPLNAFMVAIICFRPGDELSTTFIDCFLKPHILSLWVGPTNIPLSKIMNLRLKYKKNLDRILLTPIYIAGLTGRIDLLKIIFKEGPSSSDSLVTNSSKFELHSALAVVLIALHNSDSTILSLISHLMGGSTLEENSKGVQFLKLLLQFGGEEVVDSLCNLYPLEDWPPIYWSHRPEYLGDLCTSRGSEYADSGLENTMDLGYDLTQNLGSALDLDSNEPSIEDLLAAEALVPGIPESAPAGITLAWSRPPMFCWHQGEAGNEASWGFAHNADKDLNSGTKSRIIAITVTSKKSSIISNISSEKSYCSLGGMPFRISRARKSVSDMSTAAQQS